MSFEQGIKETITVILAGKALPARTADSTKSRT
jgi:hypothetical protein